MRKYGTLFTTGMTLKSSMTIKAYDYTTSDPWYNASQSDPITASADTVAGRYYFDIDTTGKYTLVLTKADSTTQTLSIGVWLEGDDEVQIDPR